MRPHLGRVGRALAALRNRGRSGELASEHGLGDRELRRVFRRVMDRPLREDLYTLALELEGAHGLTRERSTFARRNVVQAFAGAARDGVPVGEIERRVTAFLSSAEIIELQAQAAEPRYTTRGLLEIERDLLDGADARRGTSVAVARPDSVEEVVGSRPTLRAEQREFVVQLTRGGDGVDVVRAAAGTGKTFALEAAAEAWRGTGIPVVGCALLREPHASCATRPASMRRRSRA